MGMTVTKDEQNTFGLSISEGPHSGVINSYVPGETYTVSLSFLSSAAHYLIAATAGNLSVDDNTVARPQAGQLGSCTNAQFGVIAATQPVKSATFTWDAPASGSGPVVISVTTSAGMYTSIVSNDISLQESSATTAPTAAVGSSSSSSISPGYEVLPTSAPSTPAQLGESCGGNTLFARQCAPGLVCAPRPGSHLPFGDVGGICVAVSSNEQNSSSTGSQSSTGKPSTGKSSHGKRFRKGKSNNGRRSQSSVNGSKRSKGSGRRGLQEKPHNGKQKGSPHKWGKVGHQLKNRKQRQERH